MQELMIFEGNQVEIFDLKGQVLFNPYHVGKCLELGDSAVRMSIAKMNGKQVVKVKNSDVKDIDFRKVNNAGESFLTESGVYKLVFKSHKPNAEAFTDWIADEVLPSLRKTGSYEMSKQKKKKSLSSANMLVKTVSVILKEAGVSPLYIAAEAKRLYKEQADIDIQIPLITDKETMPKLYDCTEIAKELGILSASGKPHNQAVSAILSKIEIEADEIVTTAFSRNGHDDVTTQYKPSVYNKVQCWLEDNAYPSKIPYTDSKGNYKTFTVTFQEVA